ncbi:hypothetical protein [Anaeromyxobacter oryzae]|uniref:hypothetical protein n=1 Tax=Anaeromyxobacter oryzae TaxID=2918170 RepID=UPI0020BFA669|nr:hypothetical protein [Anaeromyxobacter oryzae]
MLAIRTVRAAGVVAAALVVAAGARARADTFSALVEPRFELTRERRDDPGGAERTTEDMTFGQRYVLGLSKLLFPNIGLDAGGTFDDQLTWQRTDGAELHGETWRGSGYAHLNLNLGALAGSGGYDRTEEASSGAVGSGPRLVYETWTARGLWKPADLPQLSVAVSRANTYDTARRDRDLTVDDVLVAADYRGIPRLQLRYSLRYSNPEDRISGTDTTSIIQSAQVAYDDKLFRGRTNVYMSGTVSTTVSSTSILGTGGTVSTQVLPLTGLSLVEGALDTPTFDKLVANPALVDPSSTVSANINIGYGVPLGDVAYRDLGAQFPDVLTKTSLVYVWVNKRLPKDIASAFTWTAYTSKDNATWTPVPLAGAVVFGDFDNRFEIPLVPTEAQYLKVVVRPLAKGVTTLPDYSEILVTKLQFFLVQPAAEVRGRTSTHSESVVATQQTRIFSVPNVSWDASVSANHSGQGNRTSYTVVNGLSLAQRLSSVWSVSGRVQRQDADAGSGHTGSYLWAASASAQPLPTLTHALTYSGQWASTPIGIATSNSLNLFNRAELYRGLSLLASGGVNEGTSDLGVETRAVTATAVAAATPHPKLTLGASYLYGSTWTAPLGQGWSRQQTERIDGSASATPFSVLYLSAVVSRILRGAVPTTLLNTSVAFSPFEGGNLQLRVSYGESLDTAADAVVKTFVSGVHWMLRPGVLIDTSYSSIDNRAPTGRTRTDSVLTLLTLTF